MKHKGFTVIELLVVIVVIVILATITIVAYSSVRDDAMDAKIRAVAKTAGDALVLYESKNNGGRPARTGYFSNLNTGSGPGFDEMLIPSYLNPGYRDGLVSRSAGAAYPNQIFRWYSCNPTGGFVIYASLNNPTPEDLSSFSRIKTTCSHSNTVAPETGTPTYNYARLF